MAINNWLKETGGRKWEGIMLPPQALTLDPENRGGVDTPEILAWIDVLADSIERDGFDPGQPIAFRRVGEKLIVKDGHMRTRAALLVQQRGKPLELIPCIQLTNLTTEAEELTWQVRRNQKLAHTPENYMQIINKLRLWGWEDTRIARDLQRSITWLNNIMALATAPADVQAVIADGSVSPTQAVALIREHGADAAEIVKEAKEKTGKAHVTKKALDNVVQIRRTKAPTPAPAPETAGNLALAVAPAPTLAEAAKEVLRVWDTGELDAAWDAAIAALRVAVG